MQTAGNASENLRDVEERITVLSSNPDIVWGAEEIGRVLGLNRRRTFHYLTEGNIPAARKIGGRWCASRRELLRQFLTVGDVRDQERGAVLADDA